MAEWRCGPRYRAATKKTHVFATALLGAALGCVATQATQVHYADAQYDPGQMRECSYLRGRPGVYPETTQIPPGGPRR